MDRYVSIVASRPIKFKPFAEIIMLAMDTDYSHVTFFFHSRTNETRFPYEATLGGGIHFTGPDVWNGKNKTVFCKTFTVTQEQYDTMLEKAMMRCGEEYGVVQNIGIKISEILRMRENVFANGKRQSNCSELVQYMAAELPLKIDINPDMITPKQIVEACRVDTQTA